MHKLLVSAYACEPDKGSEQGVGWHWVLEMAKTNELWVITRANNRQEIEGSCPHEITDRLHFVYYDLPEWVRNFKRKEKGLYLYYALWQVGAYQLARRLTRTVKFDYSIHLTFGNMWLPTFIHKLQIPFIWGPVGGGECVPFRFISSLPLFGRLSQYARLVLIRCAALNPFFSFPAHTAKAIIARTEDSKTVFPKKYRDKVRVILETGMNDGLLRQATPLPNPVVGESINLLFVGRLIPFKNVESALRALSLIRHTHRHVHLTILGDGPLKKRLISLAKTFDIVDRVRFLGAVPRNEVLKIMQQSHIFLFPSLREGGAWSLMEAMTLGLPVICIDTSGMHTITDDTCAIRIQPTSPQETIKRMAQAIVTLTNSAELRSQMGECGRKRIANHFLWPEKGRFIENLLTQLDEQSPATRGTA